MISRMRGSSSTTSTHKAGSSAFHDAAAEPEHVPYTRGHGCGCPVGSRAVMLYQSGLNGV